MSGRKDETISGFNAYIDELKDSKEDIVFTLVQFDNQGIDVLHDAEPVAKVKKLTAGTYLPRAWTNLYDAMGKTMTDALDEVRKSGRKVVFATLTDGLENASTEWTLERLRDVIREREKQDKWTFVSMGIGHEAWSGMAMVYTGTMSMSNNDQVSTAVGATSSKMHDLAKATIRYASARASGQSVSASFWGGKDKDDE